MKTLSPTLSEHERTIRQRLKNDFDHYASRCLWIRPKKGPLVPLRLNRAQSYIHARIEEQRRATGRVRALTRAPPSRGMPGNP